MNKSKRRNKLQLMIVMILLALGLVICTKDEDFAIEPKETFNKTKIVIDKNTVPFDKSKTVYHLINELGFGWNLGNTFDAFTDGKLNEGLSSETVWGNPETTQKMINAVALKGFKSIRIPVSWHNHLIDKKYTIDPEWMKRVKEVVDWCLEKDLYVILNTHHDNAWYTEEPIKYGQGYFPLEKDMEESEKFLFNVWRQIAIAFNDGYNERLIFEGLNEPRMRGMKQEWYYEVNNSTCKEAANVVNEYQRLIVKAIRESGGNNEKRFILVTALSAGYDATMNSPFIIPDDKQYNPNNQKIMLSVHMYSPYDFAMNPNMSISEFTGTMRTELYYSFKSLYNKYAKKGTLIVIGEMGAINKNNTADRITWGNYFIRTARKFQMTPLVWDNGVWDNSKTCDDIFGHFKRKELTWENYDLMKNWIVSGNTPLGTAEDIYAVELSETFNRTGMVKDDKSTSFNERKTAYQVVNELGFGWNLGNTFDAFTDDVINEGLKSETAWGNRETSPQMIDAIIKKGFEAIRIPVTWHNHLIDNGYTIDPQWMKRVKTVVDWCISRGLYVILNTHHDNAWYTEEPIKYGDGYFPLEKDMEESERFLYNVWKQIAIAFNNGYDEHLIFEGLNEPRMRGMKQEWYFDKNNETCLEAAEALNEYQRLIVNTIRATGGNNIKRFILVTALSAGFDATMNSPFVIPDDSKNNPFNQKLMLSLHMYSPYDFAMNPNMSISKFTKDYEVELYTSFRAIYNKFVRRGIRVVMGEMGAINKNNNEDRIAWGKYYIETARSFQITPFVWDNGKWDNSKTCDDIFGHFHRYRATWENDEIIDAWIKAGKTPLGRSDNYFIIDPEETFDPSNLVKDEKNIDFDNSKTSYEIVNELGFGWNLGNTFDAFTDDVINEGLKSETAWGNPKTTPEMIDAIIKKGFEAIRIPVTWHNHLIDKKYTIDPEFMERVKTVVDWCISRGLYVILNTHHDNAWYTEEPMKYGEGYFPLQKDMAESEKFLYNVWRQITIAFNNGYDEHLIFEGLNEPRMRGMKQEWYFDRSNSTCLEAASILNEYQRLIVKAIRESGGNNEKRFILVTALSAGYDATMNSQFFIPNDNRYNEDNQKILLSVHMYSPYDFAMNPVMSVSEFTNSYQSELYSSFKNLYDKFVKNGINIVIGEMGAVNKNNTDDRISWGQYFIKTARKFQMTPFVWDNGVWDNSKTCDDIFGHFQRKQLTWENDKIIDAWIKAGKTPLGKQEDIFQIEPKDIFDKSDLIKDDKMVGFNNSKSANQIISELGFGWNLGNTFDAFTEKVLNEGLKSETAWGNPKTTPEMIDAIIKKGFEAIRIPVTWHNHLIDYKYTIDPEFMERVKTVVDLCISRGLYVILNTHHDNAWYTEEPIKYGQGYFPLEKDMEESERFLYNVWRQIAIAFNNGYDEHLIFEGLNEPRMRGMIQEWYFDKNNSTCLEAAGTLNEYQRLIVKAIRESGGNNEKRFILVTALSAGYDATMNSPFSIPNDRKYNPYNQKIMLSVHMYSPYDFAMNPEMHLRKFSQYYKDDIYTSFKHLHNKYVKKGINIVIGEMGAVNKNNTDDRIAWGKYYIETSRKFQFTPFVWDNGKWDNSKTCDDIFGHFKRKQLTWENDKIIDAWIKAGKTPLGRREDIFYIELEDSFKGANMIIDSGDKAINEKVTAKDIVNELGFGWNLGNTFDAFTDDVLNEGLKSEKAWGNPETTSKMIDALVEKGFKAIRIPVTWHNHLVDIDYTIDPVFMERVKTVVDWCIEKGLYVILNTHHDNAWYIEEPIQYGDGYFPLEKDMEESERFLYNVWRQIAIAFNDGYDEHLIFEGLNEPRMRGMNQEWYYEKGNAKCEEAANALNEYQRLIVRTIRETGGNNEKRFILVTALSAGFDATMNSPFIIPSDRKYNPDNQKIMLSVHMYSPYDFAMKPDMAIDEFTDEFKSQLFTSFRALYDKYVRRGINIVIGEMGAINKNNTIERILWGRYYIETARAFQMTPFIWDNGKWNNAKTCDDIFGHFQRSELTWQNEDIIKAWIKAGKKPIGKPEDVFHIDPIETYDSTYMIIDTGSSKFNETKTAYRIITELGFGWNLGNTFDAFTDDVINEGLKSEKAWGNPETTPEMIDALVDKGFKAIRIPVTWHNHLIDKKYTIDPEFMERVKTVVDWCIERDLYVIINTHHDNAWYSQKPIKYGDGYFPLEKDMEESERFLYNVWKQIATAFNEGYDEHLIFEGLNEPRMRGMEQEWYYEKLNPACIEAAIALNEYQRLIVRTIRETGGNNEKRFILVTALSAGYDATMNSPFSIPDDQKYNPYNQKIMLSVHMYSPYDFAMNPDMTIDEFTTTFKNDLSSSFRALYNKYVKNGINIVIGEMGAVNKNNTDDRIAWGKYYIETARKFQMTPFVWDNGYWDNTETCDDIFGHFKRKQLTWENDKIINAWIKSGKTPLGRREDIFYIDPVEKFDRSDLVVDEVEVDFDDSVTDRDIIEELGFGWNLGNTFDTYVDDVLNVGLSSETAWGNPKTTSKMIDALVDKGFKAIRIPVSWHNHLIDYKYTIDPEFMERVKKVVDWCIERDLYVIINTHHDNAMYSEKPIKYGDGYFPLEKDMEESEKYLYNVWKQIAIAFNNGYDEHLIFEGLNEPRMRGMKHEWYYEKGNPTCEEAANALNEYQRLIVKAIRETGGNNEKRFILVTALSAGYDATMNSPFIIPNDRRYNPKNQKIMLSVHMYSPYNFAMNPNMDISEFDEEMALELFTSLNKLYTKFVENGINIVIGEMGAVNKNNTDDRISWGQYFIKTARKFQMTAFVWDNGYWDNSKTCDDIFGHFQREQLTWENDEIIDAWIKAGKTPLPKISKDNDEE